jgi:N-acylneuraminate cytidylyltransferase
MTPPPLEVLAVIPARGGSKGIPRKNVLPLAGLPLVAHNILQARLARLVSRVVVSTDDAEIGAAARKYGAGVIWRPAEISGDTASSEQALLHTLETLAQSEGYQPDLLAFLQCTSPLTLAEDIDGTIQALLDAGADTSLAVTPFHYFLWKDTGGEATGINHDKRRRPLRQEREPQYLETGAVYVMRAPGFRQARHRFFGKTAMYVMPGERRLEIDEPVDFQVAEMLLRHARAQTRRLALPRPVTALALDFDGVFTDDGVLVMQDGQEGVICSRSDGMGIARLKKTGLPVCVFSSETNPVVQARCAKLSIPCRQGLGDKAAALQAWLDELRLDPAGVVYLGNDINDLGCLALVGCPAAVADAHPQALAAAQLVLERPGGRGAIRELCELILEALDGAKSRSDADERRERG